MLERKEQESVAFKKSPLKSTNYTQNNDSIFVRTNKCIIKYQAKILKRKLINNAATCLTFLSPATKKQVPILCLL